MRSIKVESFPIGERTARYVRNSGTIVEYQGPCGDREKFRLDNPRLVKEASSDSLEHLELKVCTTVRQIDSVRGPKPPKGRWTWHPCQHLVRRSTVDGPGRIRLERENRIEGAWWEPNGFPEGCEQRSILWSREALSFDSGPFGLAPIVAGDSEPTLESVYLPSGDLLSEKLAVLARIAMDNMLPKLVDDHSLTVFIAELKDVPGMVRRLYAILRHFPAAVRAYLTRPASELSSDYLATVFGWLPFVSDMKILTQKFLDAASKIDSFISGAGKEKTLHFQKALNPLTFQDLDYELPQRASLEYGAGHLEDAWLLGVFDSLKLTVEQTRKVKNLKYHASLRYRYEIPHMEDLLTQFCIVLDYWGIRPRITDVWELIPFSFVIDWFLGVQGWLSQFDTNWTRVDLHLSRFCHSISYEIDTEVKVVELDELKLTPTSDDDSVGWTLPSQPVVKTHDRGYHRWVAEPLIDEEGQWDLRLPHGGQIITGTALAERPFERALRSYRRAQRRRARGRSRRR